MLVDPRKAGHLGCVRVMTLPHPGPDPSQNLPGRTEPEAPKQGFLRTWANKTPISGEMQVFQEAQRRKQPEK